MKFKVEVVVGKACCWISLMLFCDVPKSANNSWFEAPTSGIHLHCSRLLSLRGGRVVWDNARCYWLGGSVRIFFFAGAAPP